MNLRTQASVLFAIVLVAVLSLNGILQLHLTENSLRRAIYSGAEAVAATASLQIEGFLSDSQGDVQGMAIAFTPDLLDRASPAQLQDVLESLYKSRAKFGEGLFLLDAEGKLIADYPPHPELLGVSYASQDIFRLTRAKGLGGVVGQPHRSDRTGENVLTISAGLTDREDKFWGVLGASISLLSPLAFNNLREQKLGEDGYIYVYDTSRLMILHPDPNRVLQRDVPPGANRLFDAAINGFEGAGETANSRGIPMLLALKQVHGTNWIVGAQQPVSSAFLPIRKARNQLLVTVAAGAITAALLGLWAMGLSLRRSAVDWERTFDGVQDAIFILDKNRTIRRLNRAAAELLGIDKKTAIGQACCRLVHKEDLPPSYCPLENPESAGKSIQLEALSPLQEGHFEISVTPILNDSGETTGSLHLIRDLTARQRMEDQLRRMAHYDPLTGLPNRRFLVKLLRDAVEDATATGKTAALLYLDLDRFKLINDTFGYRRGEEFLKVMAERINAAMRPGDMASRVGPDEFVIIFGSIPAQGDLNGRTERLLDHLSRPARLGEQALQSTASIGIALAPEHGEDPEILIRNAEISMVLAKQSGGNNFRIYSARLSEKIMQKSVLATHLRHALEREELELYYQPKIDLRDGSFSGLEALLRWTNPDIGSVPPSQFVPIAEEIGLIHVFGEWVLRTACSQTRILHLEGHSRLKVSVNLSPHQLRQPDLVERVRRVLDETGLEPSYLELELTETVLMENLRAAAKKLASLRKMGIKVSIDDFGTGYSALNYLKRLPLDKIKIDRAFIRDIDRDPNDASIVDIILTIAHSMGMQVTAEGVETEEQLRFLVENGCEEAQGHLFSPAVPPDKLRLLLLQKTPLADISKIFKVHNILAN